MKIKTYLLDLYTLVRTLKNIPAPLDGFFTEGSEVEKNPMLSGGESVVFGICKASKNCKFSCYSLQETTFVTDIIVGRGRECLTSFSGLFTDSTGNK